jgi:hypothetical protein
MATLHNLKHEKAIKAFWFITLSKFLLIILGKLVNFLLDTEPYIFYNCFNTWGLYGTEQKGNRETNNNCR